MSDTKNPVASNPWAGDDNKQRHTTEELIPLVYDELRRLAAHRLAQEPPGQTFQATSLVHEVFLRLAEAQAGQPAAPHWESRTAFLFAAAEAMRRILVDAARRKGSVKHGGGYKRLPLQSATITLAAGRSGRSLDVLALDEALADLEQREPDKARLVKLRFFAGLTIDEAAQALGISRATAKRYWVYARAWLFGQLGEKSRAESGESRAEN